MQFVTTGLAGSSPTTQDEAKQNTPATSGTANFTMDTDVQYEKTIDGFTFRSPVALSDIQCAEIIGVIHSPPSRRSGPLAGRTGPSFGSLSGIGEVAVKHYRKGGTFRWLFPSLFLRRKVSRSEHEMRVMLTSRHYGIPTPEPIASVTSGNLFGRTWLVTRKLPSHSSLAELAGKFPDKLPHVMQEACDYLKRCIDKGIFHVDLHPGNIVVLENDAVVFLDFDKATIEKRSKEYLRDQYIFRWRRAVIKHRLSDELSELFCAHLKQTW